MWIWWLSANILGMRAETEDGEERSEVYIEHLRPSDSIADFVCVFDVSRWPNISWWIGHTFTILLT
jgi:hypothetical protein